MDNERRYSAAHHPSIFASVRPATKTAFLLIKDSRLLFFLSASFFLTATMMIRVSSPKACEIRGISHKQKRKDQKMKKHSKHSGFFLVSLRDVVSIAKQSTRFVRREGSLRSGYLGPQRLKHYNVTDFSVCRAFNSPSATGVFILGVNDFSFDPAPGSGLFRFPFFALFAGKSPRRVCATPWSAHPSIF